MFNKGDIVKCIDVDYNGISLNKRYTVLYVETSTSYGGQHEPENIKIIDDSGYPTRYYSYNFELDIKYLRKRKILKCLTKEI